MKIPTLAEYSKKYSVVKFERKDGILLVTLHTKDKDLVWTFETDEEIGFMFGDIGNDRENKVIILTGTGDTFITKEEFSSGAVDPKTWQTWLYRYAQRLIRNMIDIPQPVISAVNGPVTIHGEFPLMGDIILAAEHAYWQDWVHFKSGLVGADGVHIVYPMVMGYNRAKYFLLTGQEVSAQEMLRIGAINEVLPKEKLLPRAWELAREIMKRPELTVRNMREAINQEMKRRIDNELSLGLMLEGMAIVDCWPFK
jgi:enoyl-CoA hydratase/carnithine racemase